jgi:hypothetical protein
VTGYDSPKGLTEKLKRSREACKILNLSELNALIKGGERSILDRVAMTELLKTTILSLYNANKLSGKFVSDVGNGWGREELPVLELTQKNRDTLAEAIKTGNTGELEKLLASEPISMYLRKLEKEAASEEVQGFKMAYLKAIVGKLLAKAYLDRVSVTVKGREGLKAGLADARLEVILGRDLIEQLKNPGTKELSITPEAFMARHRVNAADFYIELFNGVTALSGESADPKDINAAIELIAQLGEARQAVHGKEEQELFNERSIDALMKAA